MTGWTYLGNIIGNAISGAGLGLCTVLGVGVGHSMLTGIPLTLGKIIISFEAAFAIGAGAAFTTGGLGYIVRAGISDQEEIELYDMINEATINMFSGIGSFAGAFFWRTTWHKDS